jgi:predicted outer membrane protein
MNRSSLFPCLGALALAGCTLTALAANGHRSRAPAFSFILAQTGVDSPSSSTPTDVLRPAERTFILQSLENSRTEAELSALAVSQARSSAIRELAQQLVSDYRDINNALETLARRKALEVPVQPTSFSDDYRRLAQRPGTAFDREYLHEISAANSRALRLCESAVAEAKDPEVRDVAGNFLPVIRDHVNKTTDLEKAL